MTKEYSSVLFLPLLSLKLMKQCACVVRDEMGEWKKEMGSDRSQLILGHCTSCWKPPTILANTHANLKSDAFFLTAHWDERWRKMERSKFTVNSKLVDLKITVSKIRSPIPLSWVIWLKLKGTLWQFFTSTSIQLEEKFISACGI